ncbi:MAG TPA: Ig-like domain-containing protein [Actinomycetota bacterium]|nr:Ig-like domain-containing protein [Actinomycetota bacterium]
MRALRLGIALALLLSITTVPTAVGQPTPDIKQSPPGQISIVSINMQQYPILGIRRFRAMFQLSRALRRRPHSFDGGYQGAVHAPDILVLTEIRPSNLEIFEHIIRQRFGVKYRIVGPHDAAAALLVNPNTVSPLGEVLSLQDACSSPADDRYPTRNYPFGRFIEQPSGATFGVLGIHFPKQGVGAPDCLSRNVEQLRVMLEAEQTPTFIAGDFNRRPAMETYECDPDERSGPLPWYSTLTSADSTGRRYFDAIRLHNRNNGILMDFEWTHEQKTKKIADCTGNVHHLRSRIDYIFSADAGIAEAHTDHPGWGGIVPGERNPGTFKYSDHRWVWGRFVVSGPAQPERPQVAADVGGVMNVSWKPIEGAAGYVLYRAFGEHDFAVLERFSADITSFEDTQTLHERSYKYAVAAVGADGGQGIESRGETDVADARGPEVVFIDPPRSAIGVGPGKSLSVRFDEGVADDSVNQQSIRVYVDGHSVAGFVVRKFPRLLKFNPRQPLKKGRLYTVVVSPGLRDRLGNPSIRYAWSFRTEEPPKKRGRGRR